jgi:large subunit ribosomal protein L32
MLPVKKTSKSQTRLRRSHHAKRAANYVDCPNCNTAKLPHAACSNCGFVRPGLSIEVEKES